MKNAIYLVLYLAIPILLITLVGNNAGKTVCEQTLEYSVEVDERFVVNKEKVVNTINEAEKAWESSVNHNLFEYNPEADFKIDLVYGKRQKDATKAKDIEKELETTGKRIDKLGKTQESISDYYNQKLKEYNRAIEEFNSDSKDLERRIEYWNSQGGAPPDVYNQLSAEQERLESRRHKLDAQKRELEETRNRNESVVEKNKELVEKYNTKVLTYNQIYGGQEFNQGEYLGDKINIYQFYDLRELRLVIAHELGHALGLDHVKNSKSIMYHFMGDQNVNNIELTKEDTTALKNKCNLEK